MPPLIMMVPYRKIRLKDYGDLIASKSPWAWWDFINKDGTDRSGNNNHLDIYEGSTKRTDIITGQYFHPIYQKQFFRSYKRWPTEDKSGRGIVLLNDAPVKSIVMVINRGYTFGTTGFISKAIGSTNTYWFFGEHDDKVGLHTRKDGGAIVSWQQLDSAYLQQFLHVVITYRESINKTLVIINNGEIALTGNIYDGNIFDNIARDATHFVLGNIGWETNVGSYTAAPKTSIEETVVFLNELTDTDISDLYNNWKNKPILDEEENELTCLNDSDLVTEEITNDPVYTGDDWARIQTTIRSGGINTNIYNCFVGQSTGTGINGKYYGLYFNSPVTVSHILNSNDVSHYADSIVNLQASETDSIYVDILTDIGNGFIKLPSPITYRYFRLYVQNRGSTDRFRVNKFYLYNRK